MKHATLRIIRVFLVLAFLSHCAHTDTEYEALILNAQSKPSPHAIIGMWHRQDTVLGYADGRDSLLFQPSGAFVVRRSMEIWKQDVHMDANTWSYLENGVWTVTGPKAWSGQYRLSASGSDLLIHLGGKYKIVYQRVE
jgi:hypothetical protein